MKRVFLLFCTGILLLCFASGCAQPPGGSTSEPDESQNSVSSPAASPEPSTPELSGLAALREEINQNGNIGAAFIGHRFNDGMKDIFLIKERIHVILSIFHIPAPLKNESCNRIVIFSEFYPYLFPLPVHLPAYPDSGFPASKAPESPPPGHRRPRPLSASCLDLD